jgi:hypothetical protein
MKYQKIKNGTFCPEGHQGDKSTIWNSEVYIYIYIPQHYTNKHYVKLWKEQTQ